MRAVLGAEETEDTCREVESPGLVEPLHLHQQQTLLLVGKLTKATLWILVTPWPTLCWTHGF